MLDAGTGTQLARVDVGGSVVASPAVTSEGWIVVGDTSGILWCIGGAWVWKHRADGGGDLVTASLTPHAARLPRLEPELPVVAPGVGRRCTGGDCHHVCAGVLLLHAQAAAALSTVAAGAWRWCACAGAIDRAHVHPVAV